MLKKIIDFLRGKGLTCLSIIICFGFGASLIEWILNKTHYTIATVCSICIIYLLVLSILKMFDPYYRYSRKMHKKESVYEKLRIFHDKVLPIIQKDVPQTIYKFISLTDDNDLNNRKFNSLENNQIWFSNVNKLNDPFEGLNCCYLKDFALDLYPYFNIDKRIENWKRFLNKLRNDFYLASFTKRKDSMPMWAHYANNYCGFCVEYEVLSPKSLMQVEYSARKLDISFALENLQKEYLNYEIDEEQLDWALLVVHSFICSTKSLQWKYEEEIRSISYMPNGNHEGNNETCESIGLKVKSILLGCNCSEKNRNRLIQIAQKIGVQVADMEFDFNGEIATINTNKHR